MSLLNKMLADLDARAPPPEVHVDNRRGGLKFRLVRGDGSAQSQRKTMLLGLLLLVILIAGGLYFPESWRERMRAAVPDSNSELPQEPVSEPESDSSPPPDGPTERVASEFDTREADYDTLLDEEKARVLFLAQKAIADTRKSQDAASTPARTQAADEVRSANVKSKPRSIPIPSADDVVDVPTGLDDAVTKITPTVPLVASEQVTGPDGLDNLEIDKGTGDSNVLAQKGLAEETGSVKAQVKPKVQSTPTPLSVDTPVINRGGIPKIPSTPPATVASAPVSSWDGQYNEALALLDAGRVSEGEQALRQILLKRPDYLEARVALARVLVTHNRGFEAQLLLEQAREALSVSAKLLLARLYLAQNEAQKAVTLLEATDGGGSGEYYAAQGNAYQKLGQFDRAAQIYQRAVLAEPNEGRWWLGLAIAFESAGNVSGAGQAYQRAALSENLPVTLTKYAEQRLRAIQQRRE